MMQSKVATKLNQIMPRVLQHRNLGAITGGGRTADPDTHAVNPEEVNDAAEAAKAAPLPCSGKDDEDDPYIPPRNPTLSESSPRVQSAGVNQLKNPHDQQRRRRRFSSAADADIDVDCVGFDVAAAEEKEDRATAEEDNKEYFKHHRASPLSELEIADTRRPITQAASGWSAEGGYFGTEEREVWRPEQIDTAEEAMRRAREIWISNAIRGDPDSPHGRVLRKLRGEDW